MADTKTNARVLIAGAGPVGMAFALMLARRRVDCEVIDARTLEAARGDRRLLALSRGTVELLAPLVQLPSAVTAPIRSVVVSSAGEFGRVVIGPDDLGPRPLGVTIRYGDLLCATGRGLCCQRAGARHATMPRHRGVAAPGARHCAAR